MKNTKIISIGGATQDVIIDYLEGGSSFSSFNQLLTHKEGSKIDVRQLTYTLGGGATNTAVSFKRLGFDVTPVFKVGNDQAGKTIAEKLTGQDIIPHASIATVQTGTSFIIPTPHKDRIIFAYHGANEMLTEQDIPYELFDENTYAYIAPLHGKVAELLPHITQKIRKKYTRKGLRIAVNPGTNQLTHGAHYLKAALPDIDLLITNKEEMCLLMTSLKPRFFKSAANDYLTQGPSLMTGPLTTGSISFSLHEYCQDILAHGVKRVVVTNGKEGVYVATPDTYYFHPALPALTVSTTVGAGDAFSSTLFGMLTSGMHLEDAIRCAVLQAHAVIEHPDAQTGLKTKEALLKELLGIDTVLLKKFA